MEDALFMIFQIQKLTILTTYDLRLPAGSPSWPSHSIGPRQPRRSIVLLHLIVAGGAGHVVGWQTMRQLKRIWMLMKGINGNSFSYGF